MRDLLFDVPWYLPTVLGIIGLAVFVNGNRRQNRKLQNSGGIVVLIAVLWMMASYLVDTPKEICQKQTRQFVRSVVDRDWEMFDRLTGPAIGLSIVGSPVETETHADLTALVKAKADQVGLKSAGLTDVSAAQTGQTVTVSIRVFSTQQASMDQPVDSEWEIDWREASGRWLVHEIRAIRVANLPPDQVRGVLRLH